MKKLLVFPFIIFSLMLCAQENINVSGYVLYSSNGLDEFSDVGANVYIGKWENLKSYDSLQTILEHKVLAGSEYDNNGEYLQKLNEFGIYATSDSALAELDKRAYAQISVFIASKSVNQKRVSEDGSYSIDIAKTQLSGRYNVYTVLFVSNKMKGLMVSDVKGIPHAKKVYLKDSSTDQKINWTFIK